MTNDELVARYQSGDENALNDLIKQNMRIIKWVANSYDLSDINGISFHDLVQEGCLGVIRAASSYDINYPNKASFISYSIYQIKSRINSYIYKRNNYDKCELNEPAYDKGNKAEKVDLIRDNEDPYSEIENQIDNKILREDMEKLMNDNLSLKDREVIKFIYGWNGKCLNYAEIGEIYGVSDNCIFNWLQIALSKLRNTEWVHNEGAIIYYGNWLHELKNSHRTYDTFSIENDVINNFKSWMSNDVWGDVIDE